MFKVITTKGKQINLRLYYGCPKADAISFMKSSYPEYRIRSIVRVG